jgi:hypothetical protein
VWIEPGLNGTLFTTNGGGTASTVSTACGLALDKSLNLTLGPQKVINGSFSTDSGWTKGIGWSISDGVATCTGAASPSYLYQSALEVGKVYLLEVTVTNIVSIGRVSLGNLGESRELVAGLNRFILTCLGNTNLLFISIDGASFSIDNVSIQQVLGNHASQATAANRPTLSARYNLLTYSEDITNATAYAKFRATTPAVNVLQEDGTASATHIMQLGLATLPATGGYVFSFRAKAKERNKIEILFQDGVSVRGRGIDLSNGTQFAPTIAGASDVPVTVVGEGGGYYLVIATFTASATSCTFRVYLNNGTTTTYSGDNASGVYVDQFQLKLGSTFGRYQRIAAATDYDTTGFPWRLVHDSDDRLAATLPALSGGNYSTTASVYFGTPQGMSSLHNQSIGTTYNLPALNTDIYGLVVVPSRLTPPEEEQLARYYRAKARIVGSEDYFWQEDYGPELSTSYILGTGWTYISSILTSDGLQGGVTSIARTAISAEAGKTYLVSYSRVQSGGLLQVRCGDTFITTHGVGSGSSTHYARATNPAGALSFTSTSPSFSGTISNISVRELKDGITGMLTDDSGEQLLLRA